MGSNTSSGFEVDVDALDDLPDLLSRTATHTERIQRHLAQFGELKQTNGQLDPEVHRKTMSAIDDWLRDFSEKSARPAADAAARAVRYYRATDEQTAETLDKAEFATTNVAATRKDLELGEVSANPRPDIQSYTEVGLFEDLEDPIGSLDPIDEESFEVSNMSEMDWYDAFSVTSTFNQIIIEATTLLSHLGVCERPYNLLEEIFKPLTGDWARIFATAEALNDTGYAIGRIERNLRWAAQGIEKTWRGNAGDGAAAHLLRMAKPLHEAAHPLIDLSHDYKHTANDMVKERDALTNLFADVLDTAGAIAASGAVAGGAASTGVGAPVGGFAALYAAYKGYKLIEAIETMFDVYGKFKTALAVWEASNTTFIANDADPQLAELDADKLKVPEKG